MKTIHAPSLAALVMTMVSLASTGCSSSGDDSNGSSGPPDSDLPDIFVFDTGSDARGTDRHDSDDVGDGFLDVGEVGDAATCPPPKQICAGACSDLSSDSKNCKTCGNACPAGSACIGYECTACVPRTCKEIGATCGTISDRCGGTIDCGTCSSIGTCNPATNNCDCAVACGGNCVDSKSDPLNCGGCGKLCLTGNCSGGTCGPLLACKLPYVSGRAFNVLFYGPNGTNEEPYLPASLAPASVTIWDEATWRSKTTTDFKTFDLIVIGESSGGCPTDPTGATYDAVADTAFQWGPAVGRVLVSELDAAYRASAGVVGAKTFLTSALQWLAIGPGTGLYVGPDCGTRHLDFLSYFSSGVHSSAATGDSVIVVETGHPTMVGITDSTLSTWGSSYVGIIDASLTGWDVVAAAGGLGINPLVEARDLLCPCAGLTFPTEALGSISGCAGSVAFTDRESLCGPGARVCTAADWMASRNGAVPKHNYWTNDALNYAGSGTSSCEVSISTSAGGVTYSACGGGATPMRVCGANPDAEGNACNWLHCGYESTTRDDSFGGCVGDPTAGTLCCQ